MIGIWALCLQSRSILIKDGEAIFPPRTFLNYFAFDGKNWEKDKDDEGF